MGIRSIKQDAPKSRGLSLSMLRSPEAAAVVRGLSEGSVTRLLPSSTAAGSGDGVPKAPRVL